MTPPSAGQIWTPTRDVASGGAREVVRVSLDDVVWKSNGVVSTRICLVDTFQAWTIRHAATVTEPGATNPDDMVIALEALTRIASDEPFGLPGDDELLARRHYARDVIATLRRGTP